MPDDYGLAWAQYQYDRQEPPDDRLVDERRRKYTRDEDDDYDDRNR